jgi:hypothetical protein
VSRFFYDAGNGGVSLEERLRLFAPTFPRFFTACIERRYAEISG